MDFRRLIREGVTVIAVGLSASTASVAPAAPETGAIVENSCYVQLWERHYFAGDTIVLYGPGRWADLHNLVGANKADWGRRANSLKVGSQAAVRIWDGEDFEKDAHLYGPLTKQANLKEKPESMEIGCG
jgi:hypothetical protein